MRLGGRIQAAIEILQDVSERPRPVGLALADWAKSHRFAGSGDRAAIGDLVHDTLRKRASQAWRMDDDSPAAMAYATLFGQWGMTPGSLAEALEGDRFAPPALADDCLAAWQARDLADAPETVRADVPEWIGPYFAEGFGHDWVAEAAALSQRAPLDIRANTLKTDRDKLARQIEVKGLQPTALAPHGLRLAPPMPGRRHPNLQATTAFGKGRFEIQDEGSQLAAHLAHARAPDANAPGQVLDYCAGGGGKTLALAAAMANRGQIFAHDSERTRLAPIHDRLRRAGVRNVQVIDKAEALTPLEARMDLVLVDAPCTGTGTWRRRPDAKWRLQPAMLETRMGEQGAILGQAARFVKPGGALVYVTCSMLACENESRVTAFLENMPDFAPAPLDGLTEAMCENAHLVAPDRSMISFTPLKSGTDGFFVAKLAKKTA